MSNKTNKCCLCEFWCIVGKTHRQHWWFGKFGEHGVMGHSTWNSPTWATSTSTFTHWNCCRCTASCRHVRLSSCFKTVGSVELSGNSSIMFLNLSASPSRKAWWFEWIMDFKAYITDFFVKLVSVFVLYEKVRVILHSSQLQYQVSGSEIYTDHQFHDCGSASRNATFLRISDSIAQTCKQ